MIARTEEERALLRIGGKHLGKLLQELAGLVVPGVSTQSIEDEARLRIAAIGGVSGTLGYTPDGARRPYPAATCISVNEVIVHGIPNESPHIFAEGDLVTVDVVLQHGGLFTDAAVSVSVGESYDNKRLIQAAHEALDAGIAAARVGNRIGDIGAAIQAVSKRHGFEYPRELCGHAVGAAVHEEPLVLNYGTPHTGALLVDGMVLAIEPMLMLGKPQIILERDGYTYRTKDRSKSVHVEHTVLITTEGTEVLTRK